MLLRPSIVKIIGNKILKKHVESCIVTSLNQGHVAVYGSELPVTKQ